MTSILLIVLQNITYFKLRPIDLQIKESRDDCTSNQTRKKIAMLECEGL